MKNRKINFIKLGILLFGISILLWNCEKEEVELIKVEAKKELKLKTVSVEKAKSIFENYQKNKPRVFARGESDELTLDPQWETTVQDSLNFTEALLTNTETIINRDGNYTSKVFFIEVNGSTVSGIHSTFPESTFEDGSLKYGNIYFNDFDGNFLDAYKVTNGIITHRLVPKQNVQQAHMFSFMFFLFQGTTTTACWSVDTLAEFNDGTLDEVTVVGNPSGSSNNSSQHSNSYYTFLDHNNYSEEPEDSDTYDGTGGGNTYGGGAQNCTGGKLLNSSTNQCECLDGKVEDSSGNCITNPCTGGKVYDKNTGQCNCLEGKEEGDGGRCFAVKAPCAGDPVPNPAIAPQKGSSGTKGAMYGNSSSGNCKRYGATHCTTPRNKKHDGIDLKNEQGDPIFAMYDGYIYSTKYDKDGAGYNIRIHSTVRGKNVLISYFHLQKNNRILQTSSPLTYVKSGDIIGYQGDSGNLKGALKKKTVDSHVHIEVREHDGSNSWGYSHYKLVDPRDYLSTTINGDGISQVNTNCN
ncbi:M23 family metallopeptidase [Polaribacter sp.]|nr:M23 family metallopeptidase [Polaribacter sp.]